MNCCLTEIAASDSFETEKSLVRCLECKSQSRPVSRKTMLLMLKPHLLEQVMPGTFSFCSARDCPVVYFEEGGDQRFIAEDLRTIVGVKATVDPVPLCYCFGFDESHLRDEIERNGVTVIPERIAKLIREGLCACESRNPSGVCCLGEVNRAAKRLARSS